MDAGKMRHRITIRRQTTSKNTTTGGQTRSWHDISSPASMWADIVGINGREAIIGSVLQGVNHYQITVRFRDDILPSDQILWRSNNDLELNVHSAQDKAGTRQWTTIHASTEAPQGV